MKLIIYNYTPYLILRLLSAFIKKILSNSIYIEKYISYRKLVDATVYLAILTYLKKYSYEDLGRDKIIIIITGPPRVGKSQVAKLVGSRLHAKVISLDKFKALFSNIRINQREYAKFKMLCVLSGYIDRVVIEGDEIITNDHNKLWENFERYMILKSLILKVKSRITPHLFIVGTSESTPREKADNIYAWSANNSCWLTSRLAKDQVIDYADLIIQISLELKEMSKNENIQYLELEDGEFQKSADKILYSLNAKV